MTSPPARWRATAVLLGLVCTLAGCTRQARTPGGLVTLEAPAPTLTTSPLPSDTPAPSATVVAAPPVATATPSVGPATLTPTAGAATATGDPVTATSSGQTAGTVSVTFTETQLTELVRPGLERGTGEVTFSGTQVRLGNGQMTIAATATVSGLSAPASLVLTGAVVNGEVVLTATSAALGPFDLPAESLNAISAGINTAVNASLRQEAPNVRPTALTIADGTLTITGEILGP